MHAGEGRHPHERSTLDDRVFFPRPRGVRRLRGRREGVKGRHTAGRLGGFRRRGRRQRRQRRRRGVRVPLADRAPGSRRDGAARHATERRRTRPGAGRPGGARGRSRHVSRNARVRRDAARHAQRGAAGAGGAGHLPAGLSRAGAAGRGRAAGAQPVDRRSAAAARRARRDERPPVFGDRHGRLHAGRRQRRRGLGAALRRRRQGLARDPVGRWPPERGHSRRLGSLHAALDDVLERQPRAGEPSCRRRCSVTIS